MTTQTDRENAFHEYLESTVEYFTAFDTNGDNPWHEGDIGARRELFYRRWQRPAAPRGMFIDPRTPQGHTDVRAEAHSVHRRFAA